MAKCSSLGMIRNGCSGDTAFRRSLPQTWPPLECSQPKPHNSPIYDQRDRPLTWSRPYRSDCFAPKTICAVVIDDTDSLHPRVNDDRTDKLEAEFLQRSR